MTNQQKHEIVELIGTERGRLGSNSKVAKKCGISEGTISQMVNNNWDLIADGMWLKVGNALGYRPQGWQIVETSTMRSIWNTLDNTKQFSMFTALTHDAGVGKTTGLKTYAGQRSSESVFYLECREWAKREFLVNLARHIGSDLSEAVSNDALMMAIAAFFKSRRAARPLLILDQANSLKSAALRTLITLFNECEDDLAVVITGTPQLEKMMLADARRDRPGGKELLSRFGRKLLHLVGNTEKDVENICRANGLTDTATIRQVFRECEPVHRMLDKTDVQVVEDLRRVKRVVQRELLKKQTLAEQIEQAAA